MEYTEPQRVTKREGEPISMNCPMKTILTKSEANDVKIAWTKDGRPIEESAKYSVRFRIQTRCIALVAAARKM